MRLLERKLIRSGIYPSSESRFLSLLELAGIPDINAAVVSRTLGLRDIFTLRNESVASEFRKWLRKASAHDARELERLYIKALGGSDLSTSLPIRALRFAITTCAGFIPFAGPVVVP